MQPPFPLHWTGQSRSDTRVAICTTHRRGRMWPESIPPQSQNPKGLKYPTPFPLAIKNANDGQCINTYRGLGLLVCSLCCKVLKCWCSPWWSCIHTHFNITPNHSSYTKNTSTSSSLCLSRGTLGRSKAKKKKKSRQRGIV